MDLLTLDRVLLRARAADKAEAIRLAGELLVQGGCVEPAYVNGMLARESTMSTYLGGGVAIPHGMFDDLERVKRTALSVVQLPDGVAWEEGERAHLVVGIAARGDEHMDMLARLAQVVEDEPLLARLVGATDAATIVECLTRPPSEDEGAAEPGSA